MAKRTRTQRGTFAPQPVTERHRAVARDIANGIPISKALPAHGFSAHRAKHGFAAIRESGPLMAAWVEAAEAKMAYPLPPQEVMRHTWWHDMMGALHAKSNKTVPILTVAGKALGTLAPENQTLVQVNVAAESTHAGQWEDNDAEPATLPGHVVTK